MLNLVRQLFLISSQLPHQDYTEHDNGIWMFTIMLVSVAIVFVLLVCLLVDKIFFLELGNQRPLSYQGSFRCFNKQEYFSGCSFRASYRLQEMAYQAWAAYYRKPRKKNGPRLNLRLRLGLTLTIRLRLCLGLYLSLKLGLRLGLRHWPRLRLEPKKDVVNKLSEE